MNRQPHMEQSAQIQPGSLIFTDSSRIQEVTPDVLCISSQIRKMQTVRTAIPRQI